MKDKRVFLFALAGALCFALATWAQDQDADSDTPRDYVPGEVLVKFAPTARPAAILDAAQAVGAHHVRSFDQLRIRHWRVGGGLPVQRAVEILARRPSVEFAEPNYIVRSIGVPDDPSFFQLWGLRNAGQLHNTSVSGGGNPEGQASGTAGADIDAPAAWDIQKGSPAIVVGVIDSGVDYTHEDLAANIWINRDEIPPGVYSQLQDVDGDGLITFRDLNDPVNQGPGKIADLNGTGSIDGGDLLFAVTDGGWADGLDNGGNGYVDDLIGWNTGTLDNEVFRQDPNDPWDNWFHGSHVSGTIGAVGDNGIGVAGVNWTVTLMPLKFLSASGSGTIADEIEAILYAASFEDDFGNKIVRVTNNSYGGRGGASAAEMAAIASSGALFVAAAGNSGHKDRRFFPAAYDLDNIISVAATDHNDQMAGFSTWHPTAVDLGAPGVDIYSTVPFNRFLLDGYRTFSGSSMASPHVAGVAALVMAQDPAMSVLAVRDRILATVDPLSSLAGKTVTGGRLNAFAALPAQPSPGVTLTPTAGVVTTEAGGTDTFSVVLNTQPTADVSTDLSSSNISEGTVSPASLTFTSANWNVPQIVTVTGVDDAAEDGDVAYMIVTTPAVSTDPDYNGLAVADVSVTNRDDDGVGLIVSSLSPNTMSTGSTTDVVIVGSGFAAGTTVTFENGSGKAPAASNVVVVDPNTITATITVRKGGPKTPRVWDVRVTNPGGSFGILADGFTVIP